nr:putative ribonuclease H-like domain-containing protein [Tanacetum cinerariifolium]
MARSIPTASKNRSASIHAGRSIPAASKNRSASIHAGRSIPAASRNRPASIHAGRHIHAGRSNKPTPFPAGRTVPTGWINHAARPFFGQTNMCFDNVHPHVNKDIGIVDSGCSRSMTGNKDKLDDFVQVKCGTVTFGGGDGKITGKGTIRTSKLNFENVYYMKELQNFNLFSVSQICDKKNKVLFIDDECLVLSTEFQLPDESQVVLCIPRRHDLYTFNLFDIQPEQHINYLLAKASLEESTKWHRRMAHVNFKTINKLAKLGLVKGLPLKLFTNDHNCVACNKGKQHKDSYKAVSAVRTIFEPFQLLHMDLFGPTSIRNIDHKYYSLVITDDFSRFCWAFFLGTKDETFYILKDFIALIENQLNKKVKAIRWKANDGFLVGYAAHSKAYRVYNLSSKKVEETLNLRYLEDKPNVQGLGQEWYFNLDYLTDSLGYTRFKTNPPTGPDDTNILTGTQADDSDSECDEQVILVPSFPSNSFSGPIIQDVYAPMENNLDYAEELARLQRQEYEAHSAAAKHGFEFFVNTAALLPQANIEICRNLVPTAGDPAGGIIPTGSVPAGSDPASSVPTGGVLAGSSIPTSSVPTSGVLAGSSIPASSVPTGGVLTGSIIPASSVPTGGVLAGCSILASSVPAGGDLAGSSVPTSDVPAGSFSARCVPAGGVLAGSLVSTDFGASSVPAASVLVPAVVSTDSVATSLLPPVYLLGFCAHTTRFPSPFDLGNHQHTAGIFSSSSYDDDFYADVTKLDSNVAVDPVATRRINSIHPQSQILGDLQSPVQTKSTVQKSKFGESAFISYVQNQNRTNHADHLHCLFACFLSQLEPSSVANALADPDWVAAIQEEMQQFYHQQVWKLVPLPAGKIAIGTKWILKNKRDAKGIVVYVDDIIFGSTNKSWCDEFEVLMKDMLKKFDMESVRTTTTPYEVPKHKSKDEPDDAVNVHLFRSMIGSLMYLTAYRPDIMFVVSACSRHQLEAYSDSDYAGSHGDRKSTTGGCQFLGRQLISWQCKKQTVVATFSTEAEHVAAASCSGQVRADDLVFAGGCTLPAGNYTFLLLDWYALTHRPTMVFDSLVKQFWATATVRTLEAGPSNIIATIDAKLFSNMKFNWDGPHMPLLAPMLVVPAGGDAAGAAANVAAGPGPSSAPQVPPVREHSPVRDHSSVREPLLVRDPTPVREPSPRPKPEPTPDSPSPPSPPPSSAKVGPTISSRPPSPSRPPSGPADIREGGGDFASSFSSNEVPQTPAATAAGGAEDSAVLTALTLKLDECLHRVTTLENKLGISKKVLGGAVLKLVTRVKRLEGLLQQRKRRLVLSDSKGEDATTMEQEFDLAALHTLASVTLGDDSFATATGPDVETTMPGEHTSTTRRRLRKPFTSSVSAHVSETIPPGVRVPAAATTIPATSSVDAAVHTADVPSSSIHTAADKGKAPMVDNSPPADLLSKHERVLKNLHDSQLGEELAKKIQAEQEAEFARQQEELAQKA